MTHPTFTILTSTILLIMVLSINAYNISVPQSSIDLLRRKLELSTFPDELEAADWAYGAPLADIKRLVYRWQDGFDWRKQEDRLNRKLPQHTVDIDVQGHGTMSIHYVHQQSDIPEAIPLLFVHGWPGSFVEVEKILPLLVNQGEKSSHPKFHVVALSLPGFGFSQGPSKRGFGLAQYAEVAHKLMLGLGYDTYVTQGGDLGYFVTRKMALLYGPEHLKAWHTNMPIGRPSNVTEPPLSDFEKAGLERTQWFNSEGSGYLTLQSTKPQTPGYALSDSPVGLLAWMYEKLVTWTDGYQWDDDEVLTWVSLYWFSRAGPTASLRMYKEISTEAFGGLITRENTTIPLGTSQFAQDIIVHPLRYISPDNNLVFSKQHENGGHFASHERPQQLVDDLREMYGTNGPAFGVVPGNSGYSE